MQIIDIKQEIKQGDKLLPAAEGQSLPAFFTMRAPEQPIEGSIIDTTADLREFSSWDIVVLNRGEQDIDETWPYVCDLSAITDSG